MPDRVPSLSIRPVLEPQSTPNKFEVGGPSSSSNSSVYRDELIKKVTTAAKLVEDSLVDHEIFLWRIFQRHDGHFTAVLDKCELSSFLHDIFGASAGVQGAMEALWYHAQDDLVDFTDLLTWWGTAELPKTITFTRDLWLTKAPVGRLDNASLEQLEKASEVYRDVYADLREWKLEQKISTAEENAGSDRKMLLVSFSRLLKEEMSNSDERLLLEAFQIVDRDLDSKLQSEEDQIRLLRLALSPSCFDPCRQAMVRPNETMTFSQLVRFYHVQLDQNRPVVLARGLREGEVFPASALEHRLQTGLGLDLRQSCEGYKQTLLEVRRIHTYRKLHPPGTNPTNPIPMINTENTTTSYGSTSHSLPSASTWTKKPSPVNLTIHETLDTINTSSHVTPEKSPLLQANIFTPNKNDTDEKDDRGPPPTFDMTRDTMNSEIINSDIPEREDSAVTMEIVREESATSWVTPTAHLPNVSECAANSAVGLLSKANDTRKIDEEEEEPVCRALAAVTSLTEKELSMDEVWLFRTFMYHDESLKGTLEDKELRTFLEALGLPSEESRIIGRRLLQTEGGSVGFAGLLRWWWQRDSDLYAEHPTLRVKMSARSAWLALNSAMFGGLGLPTIVSARLRFLSFQAQEAAADQSTSNFFFLLATARRESLLAHLSLRFQNLRLKWARRDPRIWSRCISFLFMKIDEKEAAGQREMEKALETYCSVFLSMRSMRCQFEYLYKYLSKHFLWNLDVGCCWHFYFY